MAQHLSPQARITAGRSNKDHFIAAIRERSSNAPEYKIYNHTGWRKIDGLWQYLHSSGAIGAEGLVTSVRVSLPDSLKLYALPEPPTGDKLVAAIKATLTIIDLAPDHMTFPLIAAIFRAAMGECPLSVFAFGKTGKGKTELAARCQQHYGARMDADHLPAGWDSTPGALERIAFLAKDSICLIDDFVPKGSKTEIEQLHAKADRVLRGQANHIGRGRLESDSRNLIPDMHPRGLVIGTGEDLPKGQSLNARMVTIQIREGDINWDQMTICQAHGRDGHFAQCMAAFIQHLAPRMDTIQEQLRCEVEKLRSSIAATHKKVATNIAQLGVGLKWFLDFAQDAGALSSDEREKLWKRGWTALCRVGECQSRQQQNNDPAERFIALVKAVLAGGVAHIVDAKSGEVPKRGDPGMLGWELFTQTVPDNGSFKQVTTLRPKGLKIGWISKEYLYLNFNLTWATIQRVAQESGDRIPITFEMMKQHLYEKGLLSKVEYKKDEVDRYDPKAELECGRTRVLHLRPAVLNETEESEPAKFTPPVVMDPKMWTEKRPFLRWCAALKMENSRCPEPARDTRRA
jgi:hypothetical protein